MQPALVGLEHHIRVALGRPMDDESNLSSSSSNDLSFNDKRNQDEKSDDNASAEDRGTKNIDGLEINLERCHEQNIDNLPLDMIVCT